MFASPSLMRPATAAAPAKETLPKSPAAVPRFGGESAFWLTHAAFWGLAGAASLLVAAVYRPANAEPPAMLAARIATLCFATAGMRWLSLRPGLLRRLDVSRAGLVAGGLLTAAVLITLAFAAAEAVMPGVGARPSRGRLVADLAVNVTLLANWCAIYFGWQLIRER